MDTSDAIKEVFSLDENPQNYKILQLFDDEKRSQHVADGEIRLKRNLDDLLAQYQDLF